MLYSRILMIIGKRSQVFSRRCTLSRLIISRWKFEHKTWNIKHETYTYTEHWKPWDHQFHRGCHRRTLLLSAARFSLIPFQRPVHDNLFEGRNIVAPVRLTLIPNYATITEKLIIPVTSPALREPNAARAHEDEGGFVWKKGRFLNFDRRFWSLESRVHPSSFRMILPVLHPDLELSPVRSMILMISARGSSTTEWESPLPGVFKRAKTRGDPRISPSLSTRLILPLLSINPSFSPLSRSLSLRFPASPACENWGFAVYRGTSRAADAKNKWTSHEGVARRTEGVGEGEEVRILKLVPSRFSFFPCCSPVSFPPRETHPQRRARFSEKHLPSISVSTSTLPSSLLPVIPFPGCP